MRKLIGTVVVLAGLFIAADVGGRAYAEGVVARELQKSLHLSERPDVSLHGFPFLSHFASGDLPSVTLEATTFRAEGIRLDEVDVDLRDVTFPPLRLVTEGEGTVRAAGGTGSASVTAASLTSAIRAHGIPVNVELDEGELMLSDELTSARAEVNVHGNTLDISTPAGATVSLPLPKAAPGIEYTGLRIEQGRAELRFRLRKPVFRLS